LFARNSRRKWCLSGRYRLNTSNTVGRINRNSLILAPIQDGELSGFTAWLTLTHTQRWHGPAKQVFRFLLTHGRQIVDLQLALVARPNAIIAFHFFP